QAQFRQPCSAHGLQAQDAAYLHEEEARLRPGVRLMKRDATSERYSPDRAHMLDFFTRYQAQGPWPILLTREETEVLISALPEKTRITGKLIEMGDLKTVDSDGSVHDQPSALLIRFDSREDCKQAINDGECKFVWP